MNESPSQDQLDQRFELDRDLIKTHERLLEEERTKGVRPWLAGLLLVVAFMAGAVVFSYSGNFRADAFNAELVSFTPSTGGANEADVVAKLGRKVYLNNCALCHQSGGQGIAGQYPTLVGSTWVNGPANRLAALVLNGLAGPWLQNGVAYNGNMQPWKGALKDEEIAAVMTYVRSQWGNSAPPISPADIAVARQLYGGRPTQWSMAELEAVPETPLSPVAPAADAAAAGATGAGADAGTAAAPPAAATP